MTDHTADRVFLDRLIRLREEYGNRPLQDRCLPGMGCDTLPLTWVDTRDPGYVYLFRHDNPLSVAVVPSAHTAYWSSQDDHLGSALQTAYGSDWYMMVVKPDTVYRLRWLKDDLMYQTWAVDMPVATNLYSTHGWAIPRDYGTYEDTALLSDADCEICGLDVGTGAIVDGVELCRRCASWWTEHGVGVYESIEEMKAVIDSAGVNRDAARKELS